MSKTYIMFSITKTYYGLSTSRPESIYQLNLFSDKTIEEFKHELNYALSSDETDSEIILHYRKLIIVFINKNYFELESTNSLLLRKINSNKNYITINSYGGGTIKI